MNRRNFFRRLLAAAAAVLPLPGMAAGLDEKGLLSIGSEEAAEVPCQPVLPQTLRVSVVGLGRVGCRYAQLCEAEAMPGLSRILFIDTDRASLASCAGMMEAASPTVPQTFLAFIPGSGMEPEMRQDGVEVIRNLLDGSQLVLILLDMGSANGLQAMERIAGEVQALGAEVRVLATLPFDFHAAPAARAARALAQLSTRPYIPVTTLSSDDCWTDDDDRLEHVLQRIDDAVQVRVCEEIVSAATSSGALPGRRRTALNRYGQPDSSSVVS